MKSPFKVMSTAALAAAVAVPTLSVPAADAAESTSFQSVALETEDGSIVTVSFSAYAQAKTFGTGELGEFVESADVVAVSAEEGKFVTIRTLAMAKIDNPDADTVSLLDELDESEDNLVADEEVVEYTAWEDLGEAGEAAVESVSAIDTNKVEVNFNQEVDTDSAEFDLKRGAVVYPTDVEWNDDKTTATLETSIDLPDGDYTVEVSGLTEELLSNDLTIADEAVTSLEVSSDNVQISDGSTIDFSVLNQYETDMEVSSTTSGLSFTAYNVTKGEAVTTSTVAGESQIEFDGLDGDGAEVGDEIRVTLNYKGLTTQKTVEVIDAKTASDLDFANVVMPEDQERVYPGDTDVQVEYSLFNQFGEEATLTANKTGASSIETADGIKIVSSDETVVDPADIDTDEDGNLVFEAGAAGTTTLTAIINSSGDIATIDVTVSSNSAVDSFDVAAPSDLVVEGEATTVDYVAADQYGTVIDAEDFGTAQQDQLTIGSSDDSIIDDGNGTLDADVQFNENNELVVTPSGNGEVTLTVKIGDEEVATLDLDVQATAVAQEITEVSFPTVFENGSSLQLTDDDVTVVDQYGREFEGAITVDSDNDSVVADDGNDTITTNSTGTATLTVNVGGQSFDVDVEVIASADVESYSLADFDTLYAGSSDAYDVTAVLNGVDADGNTVVLADTDPDFITSSNTSVATVDNNVEVRGEAEGTSTITAWKDGEAVATSQVEVSEVAPVADSVSFSATTVADPANVSTIVDVLDQYGVEITSSTALFFTGGTEIAADGTISDADDAADVTETITVITENGLTQTADITID